jgi:hypothetical protein
VGSKSFTIERRVGRLVEVRIVAPLSTEDLTQFPLQFTSAAGQEQVVACADMRGLNLLGPGMSEEFGQNLRQGNSIVLRSALLVPKSAAAVKLQMNRMTREAGVAIRRVFDDPLPLCQWMSEVLTAEEATRLASFLGG